jgi:hypothetical protein
MKHLVLYLPIVMTNEELILATIEGGSESFKLERKDWVVAGNQDDIVHVVTPSGLERLLRFLDRLIEAIQSPGAQELILKLFAS